MDTRPLTMRLVAQPIDRAELGRVVDALNRGGLEVISAQPTGFTISGPAEKIAHFFKSTLDVDERGPRFSGNPTFDRLPKEFSYRAYFPTKPTYY